MTNANSQAGIGALLTPDNCAVLLIDHQAFQITGVRSHDTQTMINNVVGWPRPRRPSACRHC